MEQEGLVIPCMAELDNTTALVTQFFNLDFKKKNRLS